MTYVIAAAGTGGHVHPALAVADALQEEGVAAGDILFLGGTRYAAEAVPAAGYPFRGFELTHLRRSLSAENLRIPLVLRRTSAAMASEIRQAEARVVLGMSGYVTVPAAMAARRSRVPFVLQEQNAVPGLAARFASRTARRVFLGLPGAAQRLDRSELVGNPVDPAFEGFDRGELRRRARAHYGLPVDGRVVGVMGGSQGARVINHVAASLADAERVGALLHLTGKLDFEEMSGLAQHSSLPWRCVAFESEMPLFYAAVDLVVCRAGAMTVTELAATRTPSVLVPLARVGQRGNAEALEAAGAATVVPEADIASVPQIVDALCADEPGLTAMRRRAGEIHRPGAARIIARHLMEVADE